MAIRTRDCIQNANCDGDHCSRPDGEIRVLPTGGGGNALLCVSCFGSEMEFRRGRNTELGENEKFDLPAWYDLKVYEP